MIDAILDAIRAAGAEGPGWSADPITIGRRHVHRRAGGRGARGAGRGARGVRADRPSPPPGRSPRIGALDVLPSSPGRLAWRRRGRARGASASDRRGSRRAVYFTARPRTPRRGLAGLRGRVRDAGAGWPADRPLICPRVGAPGAHPTAGATCVARGRALAWNVFVTGSRADRRIAAHPAVGGGFPGCGARAGAALAGPFRSR